jgi:hypothetical protein
MMKKVIGILVLALLIIGVTAALAEEATVLEDLETSTPVSDGGAVPVLIPGNSGGNRTCEQVGQAVYGNENYFQYSSTRINYDKDDDSFDSLFPSGLSVSVTNGTYVAFDSTFGIGAVIVKGSNDANVYVYNPQEKSDSGLAAPPNQSGNPAGLSNITFCWNPEVNGGEWCSPGYWRQEHHLDSWEATEISPDELYSDYFDAVSLSKKALKDGAIENPTLWDVLHYPQWYGGEAFNNVGDLLSEAHPDVDFNGERVEDSCPLN